MRILQYRSFTAFLLLLLARTVSVAQISSVNYYRTLDAIFDITAGPDGAMWFISCVPDSCDPFSIGRMTLDGAFVEYPTPNMLLVAITAAPDSQLWFADSLTNSIGRFCTSTTSPTCPSGVRHGVSHNDAR